MLDAHGQPTGLAINASRRADRDISEMLGLVKGMLFDGTVSDIEAQMLAQWLERHPDLASHWSARAIRDRLLRALADGVIDEDERHELQSLMGDLVGGKATTVLGEDGASTLPIDTPLPTLQWTGQVYVFTGQFAFGTRAECEREVFRRGGACEGNVTKRTGVLVIGTFGSRDWAQTSFGRKIEKAVSLRSAGQPLSIVPEDYWASVLG